MFLRTCQFSLSKRSIEHLATQQPCLTAKLTVNARHVAKIALPDPFWTFNPHLAFHGVEDQVL